MWHIVRSVAEQHHSSYLHAWQTEGELHLSAKRLSSDEPDQTAVAWRVVVTNYTY